MAECLSVSRVSKRIKKKQIIEQATFTVDQGQVVGLVGPNGAGKTTLIRMIVGLMSHDSGEIHVMGRSLNDQFKPAIQSVGAIVENPEFYNYLSGYDNLLQYRRMSNVAISKSAIDQLIKQVHLEKQIDQKVKTYSLGMRQRLGIAQALIHSPNLLVLDEPMNGLDPKGMKEFREMILTLRSQGIGILISSHQLSDMEQFCDQLVVIQQGKITHVGPTETESPTVDIYLETTDNERAITLLSSLAQHIEPQNKGLVLKLTNDTRTAIIEQLVGAGIGVKELRLQKKSLEENFLEWTEEGGL